MRPEYLLTDRGRHLGPGCRRLQDQLTRLDIADVALRKWSLPVIYTVAAAGGRFNRIRAALAGATPRALSTALRDLQDADLVERFLVDDDPPRTEYGLTLRARRLLPVLSELARVQDV
jgi:DNA-binding HxlR family transcriptional regulator